jgi:quinolinate synthase
MLWQPSLPDVYIKTPSDQLAALITARRRELGSKLVILGHHYQTAEVIQHADVTGDSLKLSQIAAQIATKAGAASSVAEASDADAARYIIFCGVHFMAETADMLTPQHVAVILPDMSAGCSMADMAQYDDTVLAWESVHESLRSQGWKGRIIPITYVNSSAAIKAFVGERGGACCTSTNAKQVVAWALAGGERPAEPGEQIKVFFLPDQHLGRNTLAALGIDVASHSVLYDPKATRRGEVLGGATPEGLLSARGILWAGHCSVHKLFRPEHVAQIREADRAAGTQTTVLVHPECAKEVVEVSDLNGSTEFIIRAVREAAPGSRWAIGTEHNLVQRIATEAAARGVFVRILSDCQCLCTTMYRIDQPHLLWVLDHLTGRKLPTDAPATPRVTNQVSVHPKVRELALLAIDRMLQLSAPPSGGPSGRVSDRTLSEQREPLVHAD